MKNLGKFVLSVMLTSAISLPAYATSGANNTASAGAGTAGASASGSGTNTDPRVGSGGTLENNTKANIDTSRSTNAMGNKTPRPSTGTVGSTNNSTIGSTANGTISSGTAASRINDSANIQAFNGSGFNRNDSDRNGSLNFDEYLSYSGSLATTGQGQAQAQFSALDTNNDNFLSRAELRAGGMAETGAR